MTVLSSSQHGFAKGRLTTTNLLELFCHIYKEFPVVKQIDVVYADFSKAFDRTDHKFRLHKLYCVDLPSS